MLVKTFRWCVPTAYQVTLELDAKMAYRTSGASSTGQLHQLVVLSGTACDVTSRNQDMVI
eukprot:579579-Amphidinium_carterae.1